MAAGASKIGSFVGLARLRHAQGLRYPTDVLLGPLILWVVLRGLGDSNPVWWDIPSGEVLCGFDHGVGHPLLLLCHAKAPSYRKKKTCKDLASYSEWLKVADVVIKARVG